MALAKVDLFQYTVQLKKNNDSILGKNSTETVEGPHFLETNGP